MGTTLMLRYDLASFGRLFRVRSTVEYRRRKFDPAAQFPRWSPVGYRTRLEKPQVTAWHSVPDIPTQSPPSKG